MQQNIISKMLIFLVLFLSNLNATIYEDAEDGVTNGWNIYDNTPAGGTVSNIDDQGDRVIKLSGSGTDNGYMLGDWSGSNDAWNNQDEFFIAWRLKYSEDFEVYIIVETNDGTRYLQYANNNTDHGKDGEYIHYGLGSSSANGSWQKFERDLQKDLEKYEPDNVIKSVSAFLIRGSGFIDDISLFNSSQSIQVYENINLDKEPNNKCENSSLINELNQITTHTRVSTHSTINENNDDDNYHFTPSVSGTLTRPQVSSLGDAY